MQDEVELEADVLVIGGGLAGTWAAAAAARAGAQVMLPAGTNLAPSERGVGDCES